MRFLTQFSVSVVLALLLPAAAMAKSPFPPSQGKGVCLAVAEFDAAAGAPPIVIDFDNLPCGFSLDGQTMCGVTFQMVNAPLEVVCAEETFTPEGFKDAAGARERRLRATSGRMLLSPGGPELGPGPDPMIEDDDVTLVFDPPVACIGFDHVSQLADGMSYTRVQVVAVDGQLLYEGTIDIGLGRWLSEHGERRFDGPGGAPPVEDADATADFWGFVADQAIIRELRIDEADDNDVCPDSNIGIDSLRYAPVDPGCGGCDMTGDGRTDVADIQAVLAQFGPADPKRDGRIQWFATDVNRDGMVDALDVVAVIAHVF